VVRALSLFNKLEGHPTIFPKISLESHQKGSGVRFFVALLPYLSIDTPRFTLAFSQLQA